MGEPWDRLRDAVLVQCTPGQTAQVLALLDRPRCGLVVTGPRVSEIRMLAAAAGSARTHLLVDASRYSGTTRKLAVEPFDEVWLNTQRAAGLPVLTDSGYIGELDTAGLDAVLGRSRAIGDCIATLPLHPSWLDRKQQGLSRLVDRVAAAGVPVAVVLEHRDDPYGVRYVLDGMLALLSAGVPVVQLRCDLSGLGLLCHGALATALGTRTGLRHLYPVQRGRGGGGGVPSVATVVRDLLTFVSLDRIATAVRADRENSLWNPCECPSCNGRQLDQLARLPDAERSARAFGHAVHMLLDLREALVPAPAGRAARRQSWRAHCDSALSHYRGLQDGQAPWRAPAALRHWYAVDVPARATRPAAHAGGKAPARRAAP